jgi:hypothetical protein
VGFCVDLISAACLEREGERYLLDDTGARVGTVLRGVRSLLEDLLDHSLSSALFFMSWRDEGDKGTYGRIGKSLTTRNEGWDSTIRVNLQEVGVEVLSLPVSLS